MRKIHRGNTLTSLVGLLGVIFCSGITQAEESAPLSLGVGPVKHVELGAVDPKLAEQGKATFAVKCSACHKIGERYVGPNLEGVTKRRAPEWIMNMILNPQEMIQKDPVAQDLFGEFLVPMTFQNVTEAEARTILEYLRSVEK